VLLKQMQYSQLNGQGSPGTHRDNTCPHALSPIPLLPDEDVVHYDSSQQGISYDRRREEDFDNSSGHGGNDTDDNTLLWSGSVLQPRSTSPLTSHATPLGNSSNTFGVTAPLESDSKYQLIRNWPKAPSPIKRSTIMTAFSIVGDLLLLAISLALVAFAIAVARSHGSLHANIGLGDRLLSQSRIVVSLMTLRYAREILSPLC